jgi:hypothetical protein
MEVHARRFSIVTYRERVDLVEPFRYDRMRESSMIECRHQYEWKYEVTKRIGEGILDKKVGLLKLMVE